MLNTKLEIPSVGFSVAGLDRAKFGFYQFQSFLFVVVIVISILLKTIHFPNFNPGRGSYFPYILLNEIQTMFSQLAKRSARVLPADLVLIMRITPKSIDQRILDPSAYGFGKAPVSSGKLCAGVAKIWLFGPHSARSLIQPKLFASFISASSRSVVLLRY